MMAQISARDLATDLGLAADKLSKPCDSKIIPLLADCFSQWRVVFASLLSEIDLADINRENHTEEEKRIAALHKWKARKGDGATYEIVVSTLLNIGEKGQAESLCKILSDSLSDENLESTTTDYDAEAESESVIKFECPCSECSLEAYLQNGCPKSCVPYLGMTTLSKSDQENLNYILKKDTKKIMKSFTDLSNRTCDSLVRQEVTVEKLVRVAANFNTSLRDQLMRSKSIDEVFTDLAPEMSFFNHDILANIIEELGDKDDKNRLINYLEEFMEFCKRKVFEIEPGHCTCGHSLSKLKGRKLFAVVLPTSEMMMKKLGDAVNIKETLADVLGVPPATLHLHRIDRGSVILVFSVPDCIAKQVFPLLKEKVALLRVKGISLFVPQELNTEVKGMEVFLGVTDHDSHIDKLSSKPHVKKALKQKRILNMATGTSPSRLSESVHLLIDKKAVRKAIARRAASLRSIIEDESNTEVFVKANLLPDKPTDVIRGLQMKVSQNPELFLSLISILSQLPSDLTQASPTEEAKQLQDMCPCEVTDGQKKQASTLVKQYRLPLLGALKKKLKILQELNVDELIIINIIQEAIRSSTLDDIDSIKDGLSRMQKDGYFSKSVFGFAIYQLNEQQKLITKETSTLTFDDCKPIKLDKDLLYHASLCSMAVNNYDTAGCVKLFQTLSRKNLKKLSISECQRGREFPKCLIAKNSDKMYFVAFESYLDFRFWDEMSTKVPDCTFGKGLESVITDLPTLFFENIIKKGRTLIITGFSLGGVLAHMLAAQLWQLPQIFSDQLISNLICITFAQPFVRSELLEQVAESFPDFTKNVHALRMEKDSIPFILGKLDAIVCSDAALFPSIVESLSHLQEASCQGDAGATLVESDTITVESGAQKRILQPNVPSKSQLNAEKELKEACASLKSPEFDYSTEINYLIVPTEKATADLQFIEVDEKHLNAIASYSPTVKEFEHYCAGLYHKSVKIFTYDSVEHHQRHQSKQAVVTSEFLLPSIDSVKVTQYGSEATVVITGKRLWFTHSLNLSTLLKEPFQVQKESVSFCARINDIVVTNREEKEVTLFSYFALPVKKKVRVDLDPTQLSPRGRQLARLEPTRLIELAFMMALLEKRQKRIDQSTNIQGEFSPLFAFIKQFLHQIATVVPYESILCTIAHGNHKDTILCCINIIKSLNVEFPFSLTMYASVIVALARLHGANLELPEAVKHPIEDYAYYVWLTSKLMDTKMKGSHGLIQKDVESGNQEALQPFGAGAINFGQLSSSLLLANPLLNPDESKQDEYMTYLQEMAQEALKQQNISQASAISDKSAVDLYKFQRDNVSLESPIQALVQGREKLSELSSGEGKETSTRRPNLEMIKVLKNARGEQFDLCIGVTCGFMYQHVRVPFTEDNPVTIWKTVQLALGSIWDMIILISSNNPPEPIHLMTKRCQKVISKGTAVAKSMYDGKLEFLVSHIDPATSAHAAPLSSEYRIYTFEQKLKELCSDRGITAETRIDDIVSTWRSHFEYEAPNDQKRKRKRKTGSTYPLLDVAKSHRTLIARWIKWSLMVNDLRSQLEQYTTIAITGLVNSGKTQLMRNLFGLDVKAGTTELRRTTVPFIYSLSPAVQGINIIDFPGADDSDKEVLEMVEFLKFISQIVIFVVNYDKAHTKAAQEWLKKFEVDVDGSDEEMESMRNNPRRLISDLQFDKKQQKGGEKVPVLVCMTHADKLLAEFMEDDPENYNPGQGKKGIAQHFETIAVSTYNQEIWNPVNRRTIGYFCFDLSRSTFKVSDLKNAGIRVPADVGDWLCYQVKNEIHMTDAAIQLETYFNCSCNTDLK